jgi:Reverse transcriptase (RNA-dependent DNA polymerase)/Integrase core domain/GAG-pre-integrase domain
MTNATQANVSQPAPAFPIRPVLSPKDIPLTPMFISDPGWPSSLTLDLQSSNWAEWSRRLELLAYRQGLSSWLDGTLSCPDPITDSKICWVWWTNDGSLRSFILQHVSHLDYDIADKFPTAHLAYSALRRRHEQLGTHAQAHLMKQIMDTQFVPGTPLIETAAKINQLHQSFVKCGTPDFDKMHCAWLVNAASQHYRTLQSALQALTRDPACTAHTILARLQDEDDLYRRRPSNNLQHDTQSVALLARTENPLRNSQCTNCKRTGHTIDFCVRQGGKMAGRTIEEARTAVARKFPRRNSGTPNSGHSANLATATSTTTNTSNATTSTASTPNAGPSTNAPGNITINGITYAFVPVTASSTTPNTSKQASPAPTSVHIDSGEPWEALIAFDDAEQMPTNYALATDNATVESLDATPFILDTGATCHISPVRTDFRDLSTIPPRAIKGLGNSSVFATAMGTIDVLLPSGMMLSLFDALYIPSSRVRLLSVLNLNRHNNVTTHFDSKSCWMTDISGSTIATGTLLKSRNLYILPQLPRSRAQLEPRMPPEQVFVSQVVPDVKTWHRRLGHCNIQTVINMARSRVADDMPIDLSTIPAKCVACVLGKQVRTPIPKIRENPKSTEKLDRVYIDLCGPMSSPSRTENRYCMNVIDDYSSFSWTFPLKSKDDAILVLLAWHKAAENQCDSKLRSIVTDNGELVNYITKAWCDKYGIAHYTTAPYTSLQNGKVERLHRTIFHRARAMRIACKAPDDLWDEFCLTAGYLTNRVSTSALNGKTPFELWFGRRPSFSHLREIGCSAYSLIHDQPKLYERSTPCILIGYTHQSKAYRLWDPEKNRVFNSFHVTFIEHLDSEPRPYRPGKVLNNQADTVNEDMPPPPSKQTPPSDPPPSPPKTVDPPVYPPISAPLLNHASTALQQPSASNAVSPPNPPSNPNTITSIPTNTPSLPTLPSTTTIQSQIPPSPSEHRIPPIIIPARPPPHTTQNENSIQQHEQRTSNDIPTILPPTTETELTIPTTLRRSSRIPVPTSHNPLSDPRLAAAVADSTAAAARRKATRATPAPPTDDLATALLAEFSPLRDTHELLPVSQVDLPLSLDEVLAALSTGNIEPCPESDDEPSWAAALASPEREFWIAGGREELQSLKDLNVFVLVPRSDLPRGHCPLKGKLVCKRKRDSAGNVVRYKVRYVAKGYAQQYGVHYDKTAAPTTRLESFRALLHLGACLDWDIQQFDVKTAFLHGILPDSESMFLEQPPGFEEPGKEGWVMRLMKSIYGMKQASRVWNITFDTAVREWGFTRLPCEWCVYRRQSPTGTIVFAVHVDDIISIASSPDENKRFLSLLTSRWDISALGPAKFALGIALSRDRTTRTISLSQSAMIDRLLEKFGLVDARPADTPMATGLRLERPDKSAPVDPVVTEWCSRTPYRELIGSLMYIAIGTRPDIAFAVSKLATFLDCFRSEHWEAGVRVLRYLKGTRSLTLVLGGTLPPSLSGYSDSDYANCPTTSRSVSGYVFNLGTGAISWCSRKQRTVADSSCYAEYIALHEASHEAVFLRQLLDGVGFQPTMPTPLLCDNVAATTIAEDHVWHSRIKHIRVKYHHIRKLVATGDLKISRCHSAANVADILTKPLPKADFGRLRHSLGLRFSDSDLGLAVQEEFASAHT